MNDMTPRELTALKLKFYDALVCDPRLSAMDLRIAWLLLSRYLNAASLVAWPSAETLASDLGSSVRGVRNSIQRLTAPGGWFKIEQGGGRRHSNVYSANFERVNETSPFRAETVNAASPFGRARGDTVSPLDGETVNARSLKGEVPFPERVNSSSPDSPLSKPIEEPFEGGAHARTGEEASHAATLKTNHARQGDRGGGNSGAQGHILLPIQGGNQQPKTGPCQTGLEGWAIWIARTHDLTVTRARLWISDQIDRIAAGRGVDSTEAGVILDRELTRRRKAAA